MIRNCKIHELEEALKLNGCQVIDVREAVEHESEHIEGSLHFPMSTLSEEKVKNLNKKEPIFVLCRSGGRATKAAESLGRFGFKNIQVVEGGLKAWMGQGKPVIQGARRIWALDRQVRFVAGSLVLLGIILSWFVNFYFIFLSVFMGAGLVFSAFADYCGMAMVLAKMPWNQGVDANKSQLCCSTKQ